jgi:DNA polymerase I-like protein with 3'-5' exonuclease and polymerase domains
MTYEARENGFTASLLGRRAHYDLWEPRFSERAEGEARKKALPYEKAKEAYGEKIARAMTHAALNRYTQMGGADMMKTTMATIWESGILNYEDEIIVSLTVHDELDGSVAPTQRGRELLREIKNIMEHAVALTMPTTTEFKVGINKTVGDYMARKIAWNANCTCGDHGDEQCKGGSLHALFNSNWATTH